MIVVEVKLISAITGRETLLGSAIIANDGTSRDPKKGDYDVKVARKPDAGDLKKVWAKPLRTGRVENYPRLAFNMWRLVIRALAAAFPEERVPHAEIDEDQSQLALVVLEEVYGDGRG